MSQVTLLAGANFHFLSFPSSPLASAQAWRLGPLAVLQSPCDSLTQNPLSYPAAELLQNPAVRLFVRPEAPRIEPAIERRFQLRSEIEANLARLIREIQTGRSHRFANLHALDTQIQRILGGIHCESHGLGAEEIERLNRLADQFHRVLGAWNTKVPLPRFEAILTQIEGGFSQQAGSILAERAVREFCQEFSPPKSARARRRESLEAVEPEEETLRVEWTLRDYQEKMINSLREAVVGNVSPWLGFASPMQTGKSFLAGPFIRTLRELLGPQARFIVLSSSRTITGQVVEDLVGGFSSREVGRFDGLTKQIRPITVASAFSLVRHLEDFNHEGPTVLINDEAYFTQSPTYRRIYRHFGLAEVVEVEGKNVLRPKVGNGLVIGLSGTGSGLGGYHLSGQLRILEAIEAGWIRHMRGERVMMQIASQEKESIEEGRMIWWEATPENANALVEVYDRYLHEKFRQVKIFAPTTDHTDLLYEAFQRKYGPEGTYRAHYKISPDDNTASVRAWEAEGGRFISIHQFGRGYRGKTIDAIWHTYQTSSPELFAQRTGRGWGQSAENPLPELYVLETAWSRSHSFANLARLLGLVEYPQVAFSSRNLRERLETIKKRQKQERVVAGRVQAGELQAVFSRIPLLESWRNVFSEAVQTAGGVNALAESTGLPVDLLAGFALGALPIRWEQITRLQEAFGGEMVTNELWVQSWEAVVDEVLTGTSSLQEALTQDLIAWRQVADEPGLKAGRLDEILARHFPPEKGESRPLRGMGRLLFEVRSQIETDKSDSELLKIIAEEARVLFPMEERILQECYLSPHPKTFREMSELCSRSVERIRQIRKSMAEKLIRQIRFRLFPESFEDLTEEQRAPLDQPIEALELSSRSTNYLVKAGMQFVGELVQKTETEMREMLEAKKFGRKSLKEIRDMLADLGLGLGMTVNWTQPLENAPPAPEPAAPLTEALRAHLDRSVEEFDLSVRAEVCLQSANIRYVGHLVQWTEAELFNLKHFGRYDLNEIKKRLAGMGLRLGMDVGDWRPPSQGPGE